MKKILLIFTLLVLILQISISQNMVRADSLVERDATEPTIQDEYVFTEKPFVMYNIGDRQRSSCFDATDSLVYFAYSEQYACVDAYTYDGVYQFTISLTYRDRGSVSIRCHDNLLYIQSRYGNVFIFDGDQLVDTIPSEDAKERGFTLSWFQERSTPIKIMFNKIYRYSETGDIVSTISLPTVIFWQVYMKYLVLIVVIMCMGFIYFHRKRSLPNR